MSIFRGEMLLLARNLRQIEQKEIEQRNDILTQPKLSKLEQNLAIPKEQEIKSLARILNVPVSFFSLDVASLQLDTPFFRKDRKTSSVMQEKAIAISKLQAFHLKKMNVLKNAGIEPHPNRSIKDLAKQVRIDMGINNTGPIDNLMSRVEKYLKIPIVFTPFDTNYVDALTIKTNSCSPVIFINDNYSDDRKNLNIGHELGHIFMHTTSLSKTQISNNAKIDSNEDQAWEFASELLMPEAGIKDSLKDAGEDLDRYASLKMEWRVSMAALIFRANKIGAINKTQYQFLWRQMSPYRKQEPITLIEESKPKLVKEGLISFRNQQNSNNLFLKSLGINKNLYELLYSKVLSFDQLSAA